ncbi:YD repeat-containing protein, partial [Oxalobacteraceae bacterium GrIS 2.11]
MKSVLTTRLHALMRLAGLRFAIVLLTVVGYCDVASAICVNGDTSSPTASLYLSASSAVAPGSVTLTGEIESGKASNCSVIPVNGLRYVINGVATATLTAYPYTYGLASLGPGTYTIYAQAMENASVQATSAKQTFTVTAVQPTISLTGPANGTGYSAPASVPMSVSVTGGTYAISSVSYYNGGTLLGTAYGAPWSFTATGLYAGSYAISARVTTTGGTTASTGTSTVTVSTVQPNISIASPAYGTSYNAPANVPITVSAAGGTFPISSVSYYNNGALLGTSTSAPWSFTANGLYAGTYVINAQVVTTGGTVATSNSTTVTVNTVAPTISLSGPGSGASFNAPASVPMTVTATGGTYPISSVSYYNGSTLLGTATNAPWSYTATGLYAGSYALSAQVKTSGGTTASSATNTVSVVTVPSTIAISSPASGTTYPAPANVPLTVTPTAGTYPITGVSYYNGLTLLGTATAAPWSITAAGLPVGTYAISAKLTNSQGTVVTSAVDTITVLPVPTVAISGPTDGTSYAPATSIPLAVSTTPGGYTINGVSYYTSSGTLIGKATAAPWSYTATSGLATGSYSIYAVVSTSTSGVTATSAPITVTVGTGSGAPVSSAVPIPVAITAPSINNPVAGSLPGSLSATVSGNAAYSIPLALPPGVGGVMPNLELDYNSGGGNGMLGMGWSLGGMSSIHRCGKTIAQDNVTSGVNFTNTDRLCLDGSRLILLSTGTGATGNPDVDYWTVGATYSTEIANFSRITSYTGSKGLAFKVESKSGRILNYGDLGDGTSYIAAQGRADGKAIVWSLGQVQDLSGNFYTISYVDNAAGEYLPSQIQYGGNNQTGLAAHLSVVFNYTTRPDGTVRYVAGSHNDMVSLLSNIKVYNGLFSSGTATEVREYDMAYSTSASSGRSTIASIQMQALNPQTKAMVAFPATTFNWGQSGAPAFTQASVAVSGPVAPWNATTSAVNFSNIIWADFNGDGMTDAMVVDTTKTPWQYNIYLAKVGGGFAAPIVWTVPTAIATTIAARKTTESAAPYPYISNTVTNPALNGWGLIGDFDGDGSSDLFLFGGYVCLSQLKTSPAAANAFACTDTGTNTGATTGTGASLVSWNPQDYLVLNTTGSGLSDIVMRNGQFSDGTRCISTMTNGAQAFTCSIYSGTNYVISGVAGQSKAVPLSNKPGMFSGSGRQDVFRSNVLTGSSLPAMEVCTSGIAGFTCGNWGLFPTAVSNGTSGNGDLDFPPYITGVSTMTDANGDGLTDILLSGSMPSSGTGSDSAICYSTGLKFDCHTLTTASGVDSVVQHIGAIDSDGAVKTLAFEYNAAGTAGTWRTCLIQNNSALNCQTITGGPIMPPAPVSGSVPDPIITFGSFLNDGTLNMMTYNQSIDATNSKNNVFMSAGTAWIPYTLAPNANLAADKIYSVTNGVGRTSSVTYTQGGQASVYIPFPSNNGVPVYPIYPFVHVANPGYLVSLIYDSNGQGGSVSTTYDYVSMTSDAAGRGSLGFQGMGTYNNQSYINKQIYYRQDWPFVGMIDSTITSYNYGTEINTSTTSNDVYYNVLPNPYYSANAAMGGTETIMCNVCFPFYVDSTTVNADLNGNDLGTIITNNISYDNFGNQLTGTVTSQLATDTSAFVTNTTNTWDNNTGTCVASHGATYVIGRQCTTSVSKTNEAGATITRTSANTYFATGLTQTETVEPSHTTLPADNLQVTNTYTRDGYGNVLTTVQNWLDSASAKPFSRSTSMTYTSDGRFPLTSTNAMMQTESYVTDPVTGAKTQLTDINGLVTTWTVDGIGRVLSQTSPGGNVTQTLVNQCVSDCPPNATTVTISTTTNSGQQIAVPTLSYANPLGQVIRTMSYGFTGTPIVTDHTFDARSRVLANYQPAFASGATATYPSGILANQQSLDDINRQLTYVTLDTNGAQLTSTKTYQGRTRTTVNPAGQTRIETYDVLNELVGVQINAFNNAPQTNTSFAYDPFGNLTQTTDPANNQINV